MDLERELNPAQREAVTGPDGPMLILAGAGSGKTRVITWRIAHLIARGVAPWRILAVTFTNKAAGEMRARIEDLAGEAARELWMGTFHAVCARLLRVYAEAAGLPRDFTIFDGDDQKVLIGRVLKELDVSEKLFAPRAVLAHIERAKNRGEGPDQYDPGDWLGDVVRRAYARYQQRLRESGAVDFGDLLALALRLCDHPEAGAKLRARFDHVLVDEFQDTNRVQYLLARALAATRSLFAVGDPDQSIYAFRGADLSNLLDFERDYPDARTVRIEQNYRSTPTILRAATGLIEHNLERKDKTLWTQNADTGPVAVQVFPDGRAEAEWVVGRIQELRAQGVRPRDIAVFYRTHAQSRPFEEALRARNLGYAVVGGIRFYERAEIKDLIAYLRVIHNPRDAHDLRRIVNTPARGIGDGTVARVAERAAGGDLYGEMVRAAREDDDLLGAGPRRRLRGFVELVEELRAFARTAPPSDVAERVLGRSGYLERLAIDSSPQAQARQENLMELIGAMRAWEAEAPGAGLDVFLERVALAGDVDRWDEQEGRVTLMTVHSAKGLEFSCVFVTGLEENVFPHARALQGADGDVEEERRLCYVAMTRARQRLFLTHAQTRYLYGYESVSTPSRFLDEIPPDTLAGGGVRRRERWSGGGAWGTDTRGGGHGRQHGRDRVGERARGGTRGRPRAGGAGARSGTWLDATSSQDRPESRRFIGQRVRHAAFGEGVVRGWSGHDASLKLTVAFPLAGVRTVLARYLEWT